MLSCEEEAVMENEMWKLILENKIEMSESPV